VDRGARVVTGGEAKPPFYLPTLLENVDHSCEVYCEEVFGPVAILEPYDSFADAVALVNESRFGLQAGVFTSDFRNFLLAADQLEVGGVILNDVPTYRVDHMPYGGVKDSGFGREGLRWAIEQMTELKLVVISPMS
jgi:acyl-CoA reductase-like NAD-dependent aldehyde dehydrogenase